MKLDIDKDVGLHLPSPGSRSKCVILLLSLFLIAGLLAYLSYKNGVWVLSRDIQNRQLAYKSDELTEVTKSFKNLKKDLVALSQENAILKATNKSLNSKLLQVEDQLTEARKKQLLYTDILSSDDLHKGLHIRHFDLRRQVNNKDDKRYHYTVVLSQAKGGKKIIKGQYVIRITGKEEGKQKSYTHRDLAADGIEAERKFSLKYYQSLEGDIVLPQKFEPEKVTLWIIPKERSLQTQRKSYQWKPLIAQKTQ